MDRDNKGRFVSGNSVAAKGGSATAKKYGSEYMSHIGSLGGQVMQRTYYLSEIWQAWCSGFVKPGDPNVEEIKTRVRIDLGLGV